MRREDTLLGPARGEVYQRRTREKDDEERGDAKKSAERELILAGDGPAEDATLPRLRRLARSARRRFQPMA